MTLSVASRLPAGRAAASDAVALLAFVTLGLVSHHRALDPAGYARDALPFLGGWFVAAVVFRPYAGRSPARLAATWATGVPAAVLVRALVLGRSLNGSEAAFLGVSLAAIGVLVVALRSAGALARLVRRAVGSRA